MAIRIPCVRSVGPVVAAVGRVGPPVGSLRVLQRRRRRVDPGHIVLGRVVLGHVVVVVERRRRCFSRPRKRQRQRIERGWRRLRLGRLDPGTVTSSGDGGTGGSQSVLQRGNDVFRRATYPEPGLVEAAAKTMAPDTTFNTNATFPANGNTQNQGTASVLYLEDGPAVAGCPAG